MSSEFVLYDDGSVEVVETDDAFEGHRYSLVARMGAEAFGTFMLVLGIVGTGLFNLLNAGQGLIASPIINVALAGGIMLMAAITAFAHVSGGHFNPAVTLGLAIVGRASWKDVLPYFAAQLAGAAATAGVLWAVIPDAFADMLHVEGGRGAMLAATANGFGDYSPLSILTHGGAEFGMVAALLVEILLAVIFVAVVIGVTSRAAKIAYPAVVIGFTLAALHIISWPVTNTSFNPVRSFASVMLAGNGELWSQLWLFVVAPLFGAALVGLSYRAFAPIAEFEGDAADGLYDAVHDATVDEFAAPDFGIYIETETDDDAAEVTDDDSDEPVEDEEAEDAPEPEDEADDAADSEDVEANDDQDEEDDEDDTPDEDDVDDESEDTEDLDEADDVEDEASEDDSDTSDEE